MNSIELVQALYKKGYLSKEAAIDVLRERNKLVKEALYRESVAFFKEAGLRDFFKKFRTAGKTPTPPSGKAPTPGWSDVGANLTKILALAGLTSASAAGIESLQQGHRAKKLNQEIEQSYKRLSDEQPRIAEMDKDRVRTHFGVLARYAPSLAANPTVAAAFVHNSVARQGIIDPSMIKTLAETQNKIDNVTGQHGERKLPFGAATSLAQSAMAGAGG